MMDENVPQNWADSVKPVGQGAASVRWIEIMHGV